MRTVKGIVAKLETSWAPSKAHSVHSGWLAVAVFASGPSPNVPPYA